MSDVWNRILFGIFEDDDEDLQDVRFAPVFWGVIFFAVSPVSE